MNSNNLYESQQPGQVKGRELYHLQKQTQLDEWKAEVEVYKAKVHEANVGAQVDLDQLIETLESKIALGKAKLAEISDANDETWGLIKGSVETSWDVMKTDLSDLAAKFK
jgi:uncharacterized protein with von Willebrand factor type A (vWA) domain